MVWKYKIFVIMTSSRFQKYNLFWATTSLEFPWPPKSVGRGQFWAAILDWSYYQIMAQIQSLFLLFHELFDEKTKKKCFIKIKIESVIVPAHFLQNGGCDVIQMSFSKIEKPGKSLPDLKSRVTLKSVEPLKGLSAVSEIRFSSSHSSMS